MTIGFIGLGNLGKAIAKRLISQGYELIVWNRTRSKALDLGVSIAGSPANLITKSDVAILNLFDSNSVDSVLNGKEGLLAGDCGGKLIIDTTTNHFETVKTFHTTLAAKGAGYLEAPVLGSVGPASQGTLTILVSGKKNDLDRAAPILNTIGQKIFFLGEPGMASKMKLINNLVLASFMTGIVEALAFGEKVGVEKSTVLDVLSSGAGNSVVLNGKKEKLLKNDFIPQFTVAAVAKDLGYIDELSRALGFNTDSGKLALSLCRRAIEAGYTDLDFAAIYKLYQPKG